MKISVAIETINTLHYGQHLLFRTLDSVYAQRPQGCEILLIDVGLPPEIIQQISKKYGREVRIVSAPGAGYFQAKNIGYREASGSIVAFPDSDCVPSKGWLAAITEPFKHGAQAVAGRSYYVGGFLAKVMNITDWGYFPNEKAAYTKFFAANNIAIRKPTSFLFDERFWRTGGDITMANDMYNSGRRIYFQPVARIGHYFPYRMGDFVEMRLQEGFHVIETRRIDSSLRGGNILATKALAPLIYYFGRLGLDGQAIKRHSQTLKISPFQAPVIFLFAAVYRLIDLFSMMLTLAAPEAFRRRYDW